MKAETHPTRPVSRPVLRQRLAQQNAFVIALLLGWTACAADSGPFAPKDPIPKGFVLVEGDILVPADQAQPGSPTALVQRGSPFPGAATSYWPGGTVPFQFDANVSAANQTRMLAAMATWQGAANVTFLQRNGEIDFVHIQNSTQNNSSVGRVGRQQFINIINWFSHSVLVHELGHCLGFYHTHTRADRDQYIQINWNNIALTNRHNFSNSVGSVTYGPYDFDSVMHYSACAFSTCGACNPTNVNCATIVVRPQNFDAWQTRIGGQTNLSMWDGRLMSFLYPFGDWRFVDQAFTGNLQNGTFFNPFQTFVAGHNAVPAGGTVWLQPGTYVTGGTLTKAMTLRAPIGGVTLNP